MQSNAEKLSWPHPLDPARRDHNHLRIVEAEADTSPAPGMPVLGEVAMAALSVTAGLVAARFIMRRLGGENGGQA